ncbi:hypothetical protein FRB94_000098 [Tulasnella sp. JGI-2019a]|nr:hypothetical protein FRB94_000098 [Tulasnella sp. JGI-2019a]KAG9015783.1 hypothetical protein FRB93_012348 [Tulasnella sp. JGI-2019a]
MKVVGLLSGGKDSCYNLVHCVQNGHEPVVLASLRPPIGKEEIDSYMYQTVGQDAIEVVAAAMELPLVRRVIQGTAVDQGSEYGNRRSINPVVGDETEDLYELLAEVKKQFPDVQAVSVGAILSNYQRVRVEHVCSRLGLTSLSYLWQRDQGELLDEMLDAELDAVIIKVAGIGLTPQHLGRHLSEMRSTLIKLNGLYGAHICGEGGEYETLTLDCSLFKSRIVLSEVQITIHSDSAFGSVAFLSIKKATLESKELQNSICTQPPLLSSKAMTVHDAVTEPAQLGRPQLSDFSSKSPAQSSLQSRELGGWVAVAGIQCEPWIESDVSIEEEIQSCFDIMKRELRTYSLTIQHVSHINILISSMELFSRINAVYGAQFGTSPPTRACVGIDIPGPYRVRMDCIAFRESHALERQALHVQSISYWAPANIGPYSQAVTVGGQVFISGQIGLIPAKMQLPFPRSLALESALSLQHVDRIVFALQANAGGGWPGILQSAVIWLAHENLLGAVRQAWLVYKPERRPVIFVVCKSIPKDALVETQVLIHTGRAMIQDEETGDMEKVALREQHTESATPKDLPVLMWQVVRTGDVFICIVAIAGGEKLDSSSAMKLKGLLEDAICVRMFGVPDYWGSELNTSLIHALRDVPTSLIPCRALGTEDANCSCALLVHGVEDKTNNP